MVSIFMKNPFHILLCVYCHSCYNIVYIAGITEGDEIVLIDDTVVAHMSWSQVMEALNGK